VYNVLDMLSRPSPESEALLRSIRHARSMREAAEVTFRNAVIDAMERRGDLPAEYIAEAAGVTRGRLYQIVKDGRR
jgi:hypothetical protein